MCNGDPFSLHCYLVKLGFSWVYNVMYINIIFLIFVLKHIVQAVSSDFYENRSKCDKSVKLGTKLY